MGTQKHNFDPGRTVCDCGRYKEKDLPNFKRQLSINNLQKYAIQKRSSEKILPYKYS